MFFWVFTRGAPIDPLEFQVATDIYLRLSGKRLERSLGLGREGEAAGGGEGVAAKGFSRLVAVYFVGLALEGFVDGFAWDAEPFRDGGGPRRLGEVGSFLEGDDLDPVSGDRTVTLPLEEFAEEVGANEGEGLL